ncbi:immunoglobulin kappa light chain-like isoform X1 [Mixophyes fleayi]|uniref:immunoglobulin kappa light chain-like isoform X1 n=1 Tax=Mixophyes fleayi TaxID=3061075 RepID=UPI003F4DD893
MLYLHFLILTFFISCAAVTIEPMANSMTKKTGGLLTARITCKVHSEDNLHWYVQKKNEGLKRILYTTGSNPPRKKEERYSTSKNRDEYELTIDYLRDEDEGTYYCASCSDALCSLYVKAFGTGTQLIITNERLKQPEVTTFITPKEHVERTGIAVYLCSLQNFFPGVIKVVWTKDGNNNELESEEGEIIHNSASNTYSLNTWITVGKSDTGNTFTCKYKHEALQSEKNLGEKQFKNVYAAEYSKNVTQENQCTDNYNANDSSARGDHMIQRAAQLTYTLLVLKSLMYVPLLIFFKYKTTK